MLSDFTPLNDLERRLIAAQQGEIPPDAFVEILAGSRVFMPICEKRGVGGPQVRQGAQPLKIPGEDGGEVLVLFTSPERAKPFVEDYPEYEGGLEAELSWILAELGVGYSISLNPGDSLGLDFEADDVAEVAGLVPHCASNRRSAVA